MSSHGSVKRRRAVFLVEMELILVFCVRTLIDLQA